MTDLYIELTTGPLAAELAPHIAAGEDGIISAIMNRADIVQKGTLTTVVINTYLMMNGFLLSIEAHAAAGTSPTCIFTVRALQIFTEFQLFKPDILAKFTQILDGLVAEPLIPAFTETDKANLLALGDETVSRAEQLGIVVGIQEIAQALRP